MAVTIRTKRRAAGGAAGAPTTLKTAEQAYNETDKVLYIGYGDDGAGTATSIVALAGEGAFVTHEALEDALENTGAGDMLKSVYDTNNDGKVDAAAVADAVDWSGVQGKPSTFTPSTHGHDDATTSASGFMSASDKTKLNGVAANANNYSHPTGDGNQHVPATSTTNNGKVLKAGSTAGSAAWENLAKADVGLGNVDNTSDAGKPVSTATQTALNAKAPLASPALTGTPTAPTATAGTNTTQIATTAYVRAEVAALVASAPGALDTLDELAAALGDDPNFATSVSTAIGEKLAKASNLSDLANAATARTNLGLGTMATQAASAVAITGGTISGVVIDGGTF